MKNPEVPDDDDPLGDAIVGGVVWLFAIALKLAILALPLVVAFLIIKMIGWI